MSSRVRVYMACSLDGFVAGPDNDLAFLHQPGPEQTDMPASSGVLGFEHFMGQVGAMLMGRTTFDVVDAMDVDWPYGEVPVHVATTRTLETAIATIQPVQGEIAGLVAAAKTAANGKDVYVDGGDLVRQALSAGLVDELCITYVPVLIGEGVRLFDGVRGEFVFTKHEAMDNGLVQLTAVRR